MRNDLGSVKRRREVAVEGIRKHLKAEAAKGTTTHDVPLTPEHTAKHKRDLQILEDRIRSSARFRKYIDRKPNTGLTSAPVQTIPEARQAFLDQGTETGPEDEIHD